MPPSSKRARLSAPENVAAPPADGQQVDAVPPVPAPAALAPPPVVAPAEAPVAAQPQPPPAAPAAAPLVPRPPRDQITPERDIPMAAPPHWLPEPSSSSESGVSLDSPESNVSVTMFIN